MGTNVRISMAGFLATAVTFGPARLGYGLFLPQFREAFGFGTGVSGYIAGAAYLAFLLALVATAVLTVKFGPKLPVVIGGAVAATGVAIVALAPNTPVLAIGIAIAAASAGFSWVPYNNASQRAVPSRLQSRVLSIVSTGTTFGVIATGLLALAFVASGVSWRVAWWIFAGAGLVVAGANAYALKRLGPERDASHSILADFTGDADLRQLLRRRALPLYAVAISFGFTNGTYLSYWIDHVSSAGLDGVSPRLVGSILFIAFGLAGIIGLLTGQIEDRIGLKWLLQTIFALSFTSLLLLGVAAANWTAVIMSAALQGACVMTLSAVFSFWSERLFPRLPSISFTAVLLVFASGNVIGPPLAALISGWSSLEMTLIGISVISLLTAVLLPRGLRACEASLRGATPLSAGDGETPAAT